MKPLTILFFLTAFFSLNAQDLKSKIPDNTNLLIQFAGSEIEKNVNIKTFDQYDFSRELKKELKISSLEDIGIDFTKNHYQYLYQKDTILAYVALFELKKGSTFMEFVDKNNNNKVDIRNHVK